MTDAYPAWLETLRLVFGAWVTQNGLEEAAVDMANHAEGAPKFRARVAEAFATALAPENRTDHRMVDCVNESGFQVDNAEDALWFVRELKAFYERHLDSAD